MSEANQVSRHSGAVRSADPGISRFRVWSFGPSRNDGSGASGGGLRVLSAAAVAFILAIVGFVAWVSSLGPLPLDEARQVSTTVVDRNGKLLRAYAMADGRWRLPVDARANVDPTYLKLLLAYEDQRFYAHNGLDPLALGRAALQLTTRGHIVSGGSTISMQLARLMEPRRQRSLYAKLRQIVRAIEIERSMSKAEILDLYLALAPYGGNLEGIRSASIAYLGKEPKRLSLAEAALLVALPQSPETRRLDRYPEAARKARDRVLDRMVEENVVSPEDAKQAKAVPVPKLRKPMPILAPHASDTALSTVKDTAGHQADARCQSAEGAGAAGARPRHCARAQHLGRHHRGRQ
ncbi:membrane carboxypeptidase/penicillin-binding protein PbpC [Bradyrhizobium japonicum]